MRPAAVRAAGRRTPVWVKAAAIAVLVGLPAWGLAMRHDRLANQGWAVNTITHEAYHLRGYLDEGVTECYAMQTMARTAQRLGVAPGAAQNLAVTYHETSEPLKPPQYRDAGCRDGGPLDLRPETAVFP